jgi:hypothetical protein
MLKPRQRMLPKRLSKIAKKKEMQPTKARTRLKKL